MLFASDALAARIERAERGLIGDSVAAVARRRPELAVYSAPLCGGLACWAGEGSPFNKVAGLGFDGPLDPARLAEVEGELARRGSPVQVEIATLADPGIAAELTGRGYRLRGFENVLGRALDAQARAPVEVGDVRVSASPAEELETWLDTVITGFATPDTQGVPGHEEFSRDVLEGVMRDMAGAAGFTRHLAWRGGEPAGGGAMRCSDRVALLCGAATRPEHRRRGIQTALLETRLAIAARSGCDIAVVTTQPGSKSQQNVQGRGFELLYTRAVLIRDPPAGARA